MRTLARLRAANAVLSVVMLLLFMLHGVGNSFEMVGLGMPTAKVFAYAVVALAVAHAVLGVVITVHTMRAQREAGVSYPLLNARFWAVRASGVAIAVFVALHMVVFLQAGGGGPYRLREFGTLELVANVCLVVAIAVHVIANARPWMVSLGVPLPRARSVDLVLVASLLLLLMAVAFVVYFLRWSVV